MNIVSFDPNFKAEKHVVTYINKKYWNGRVLRAQAVVSDDPQVLEVYQKAGIPTFEEKMRDLEIKRGKKEVEHGVQQAQEEKEEQVASSSELDNSEESTDWRDLPFFSMRALALKHTDQTVRTKQDVVSVLEQAEREGRL